LFFVFEAFPKGKKTKQNKNMYTDALSHQFKANCAIIIVAGNCGLNLNEFEYKTLNENV
jgi:hypothetical protein